MIQPRWSLLSSFAGGLLGLLALACPGTPLLAQGAPPAPTLHRFSAKQCVRYALDNNQNIRQAKLDVLTSKQDVREAIGQGLPQINGFMGLQNNYILPTTLIPTEDLVGGMAPGGAEQEFVEAQFGTDWFANAGVEMSQLLFDGKYFLGVSASREVVDVNRRRQEITEAQTIAGVRSAYYQVLVAKKNVELISANLKRLEKLHSDTKAYVDEGFAEHIELKRVEVQLNNLRTRRANARDGISLAKRVLKLRMGMPQSHRIILTDSLALNDFNISALDTSITVQPERRAEYRVLQQRLALQDKNEKRFQYEHLPRLTGNFSFQYQKYSNDFEVFNFSRFWFPAGQVGVTLSIPIFNGFQTAARVQRVRINRERIQSQQQQFKASMQVEINQARTKLIQEIRSLRMQERNLELAEEVYRAAKLKYGEGLGSSLEVTEAQSELTQAQTNYTEAILNAYLAQVELDRVLGKFSRKRELAK